MKKLLTLPNILKLAGALLGIIAFALMFANQLYAEVLGHKGFVAFDDAMFGEYGSAITFIGYLLILIAALGLVALVLIKLDAKHGKLVGLCLAGLLILGAIFVFIEAAVVNGRVDASMYHLAAAPVFAGIFAILAGLAACASEFLKK